MKCGGATMKILILSCNTGEGHHSAALAIKEVLDKRGLENEITDPVSFAGGFCEPQGRRHIQLYDKTQSAHIRKGLPRGGELQQQV